MGDVVLTVRICDFALCGWGEGGDGLWGWVLISPSSSQSMSIIILSTNTL